MSKRPSVIGSLNLVESEPSPVEVAQKIPTPARAERARRGDIVHTSVYVPKAAYQKLREIAFTKERKVHDLIMEGIDAVLERNGHPPVIRQLRSTKAS
jgi:hypothetical protein